MLKLGGSGVSTADGGLSGSSKAPSASMGSSDKGKSSKSDAARQDKGKGKAVVDDAEDHDGNGVSDGNEDNFS